eukprot:3640842-Amphidinium_carterae.1
MCVCPLVTLVHGEGSSGDEQSSDASHSNQKLFFWEGMLSLLASRVVTPSKSSRGRGTGRRSRLAAG